MSQLNTLALRDALIGRITDFALDDHFVRDENLTAVLRQIWSGPPEAGGLGSDLWVEGAFPSEAADETMGELGARGLVHPGLVAQLDRVGAFPAGLKPYRHQFRSIECAARAKSKDKKKPAIVVTAGTGAGKTESFLIPMLNELWDAKGEPGQGVSALILYPMNALVNDQVKRLDEWLAGQKQVSFFHFTSETPENAKFANQRNLPAATEARFRTRKQARGWEDQSGKPLPLGGGPTPDVLVTNYSMLEYMLCRPQDGVFFGSNLRVVVLDEAHIYSGNLAAEITLLLRRVLMRCGRLPEEVLFIATSATIGGGAKELKPFAATLFSKSIELVEVIEGKTQRPSFVAEEAELPLRPEIIDTLQQHPFPDEETLVVESGNLRFCQSSIENWELWRAALAGVVPLEALEKAFCQCGDDRFAGPILENAITHSPALAALQGILWNGGSPLRIPLRELSEKIFDTKDESAIDATRQLLQIGALARKKPGALPLIANRIHYLMRGPEGINIAFEASNASGIFPLGSGVSIFSSGADPSALDESASHALTLFRCNQSGWWGVAAKEHSGQLEPIPLSTILYGDDDESDADDGNSIVLTHSGISYFCLSEVPNATRIYFDPATGRYGAKGPVELWKIENCPVSNTPLNKKSVGWFAARARLQLSVLAETALASMPEYPDDSKAWKPARGRRLLVFSDSRAEAARLGPRLTRQHELQVFRAAVVDRIDQINLAASEEELQQIQEEIEQYRAELEHASEARRSMLQRRIAQAEEDLQQMGEGGTVKDWVEKVKESGILSELYHAPGGKDHQAGNEHAYDAWESNREANEKSLAALLGRELARRPAWPSPSLETLGLVEVFYPGLKAIKVSPEFLGILPPKVAERLETVWPDFLAAILDSVRNQGAITLGAEDADRDYQYGNNFLGKWFSQDQAFRRSMIPLIGEHVEGGKASRRNAFARDVLTEIGLERNKAEERTREFLSLTFSTLAHAARSSQLSWLKIQENVSTNADNSVSALQIVFPSLGLRRPSRLYHCDRTGQVWPRSVIGLYPGASTPSLKEVNHEQIDLDPRLGRRRRELRDWNGFKLGLWAEEHSAQLSPEENARLQNLFREGRRNILSSTTTLELGIDIGGLSAVLLGNLPPGKANYLQRAGRAGRRADGTSAVIGFARPSAYEREVFLDFGTYLDQELRKPSIFLERTQLVRRHAHAWLLGEFFRSRSLDGAATGAMDAYGKMGRFTGRYLPSVWKKAEHKPAAPSIDSEPVSEAFLNYLSQLAEKPTSELQLELSRLWSGCTNLSGEATRWNETIISIREEFRKALREWGKVVDELLAAWSEIPTEGFGATDTGFLRAQANAIFYQLLALHHLTVIESLGDARVLPRYGFPIGLSRLRVQVADGPKSTREEDQFRLQRDGMMAMREYAPGSQLLVGGQIVTSRGLLKHWTGAIVGEEAWGLRGQFVKTSSGLFNYSVSAEPPEQPPTFGQASSVNRGEFLFPRHGFTTAAWDPPRYGNDFETVGSVEVFTLAFDKQDDCDLPIRRFCGLDTCVVTYRNGGELFLLNSGANNKGFSICQRCGYAESERGRGTGRVNLPNRFDMHAPLNAARRELRCWNDGDAPVWRNHHLAARQTTNLLKFDFGNSPLISMEILYTIGQALRLAGAAILAVDERELGILDPAPDPATGIYRSVILYDSLAGGSGHLAELCHPDNQEIHQAWVEKTIELLTVEGDMADSVRHRELMRRLLTASCDDSKLVPELASQFLLALKAGSEDAGTTASELGLDPLPLKNLISGEIPEFFALWIGSNEMTGVPEGALSMRRWESSVPIRLPERDRIIVLRLPNGSVGIGKWLYQKTTHANTPHKIRLRRSQNPILLELTDAEFQALQIIAPNP